MKWLLTAGFTLAFFYLALNANSNAVRNIDFKNDLSELRLKGKVKSVKIRSYIEIDISGDLNKSHLISIDIYNYNKDGYLSGHAEIDPIGSASPTPDTTFWKITGSRKSGQMTFDKRDNSNRYWEKEIWSFDSFGNKTEVLRYDYDSLPWRTEWFKYNAKNQLIGTNTPHNYYRWFEYDEMGRLLFEYETRMTFRDTSKTSFVYDRFGSATTVNTTTRVDDNFTQDRPSRYLNSSTTFQYEYDAFGNVIKRIEFHKGKTFLIEVRAIEYYRN